MKWFKVVIILITLFAVTNGCSSSKNDSNISVNVDKISLNEISFEQNNVDTSFQISNNNKTAAFMDEMEYKIYLGHNDRWMHVGLGEMESVDIEAESSIDFTNTTIIEKKNLSETVSDKMLGAKSTMMKIDGSAWFTVGSESFEIQFTHEDDDPHNPRVNDQITDSKPVTTGTEGAENE